jgi:hypothetical protein
VAIEQEAGALFTVADGAGGIGSGGGVGSGIGSLIFGDLNPRYL